jgi:DNA-binding transcriptional ArsR family regulator
MSDSVSKYLPLVDTYEDPQLDALGDGTRRAILARLLLEGPMAVGDIAFEFHVSRPAVSQHLRVLKHAHLVRDEQQGTRRVYELDPRGFQLLQQYFDQFWTQALLAFKQKAEETAPRKSQKTRRR